MAVPFEPPPSDNIFITDLPGDLTEDALTSVFEFYGQITSVKMLSGPKDKPGVLSALMRFSTVEEASWVVENVNGNVPQGMSDPVIVRYANNRTKNTDSGFAKGASGGGHHGGKGGYGKAHVARYDPYAGGLPNGDGGRRFSSPAYGPPAAKGGKGSFGIDQLLAGLGGAGVMPGGGRWENDDCTVFVSGLPPDTKTEHIYSMFAPFGAIALNGACAKPSVSSIIGFVNFLEPGSMQAAIATLDGTTMPDGGVLQVKVKTVGKGKGKGKGSW